jgi:hypothetical protein
LHPAVDEVNNYIIFFITAYDCADDADLSIGTMLSTNRWAEEIPNSCEQSSKGDVSVNNYLPPDQHMLVSAYCDATALLFLHISEQIPSNHSFDVVSPLPMQ